MKGLTQNPVEVVEFYLKKSNSDFEVFFQAPRVAFGSETWFKKEPLGKNPLGNMMQSFSRRLTLQLNTHSYAWIAHLIVFSLMVYEMLK